MENSELQRAVIAVFVALLLVVPPLIFSKLAKKYLFKQAGWQVSAVFIAVYLVEGYFVNMNRVSFLGYLDWLLLMLFILGVPALIGEIAKRKFQLGKWTSMGVFCLFVVINTQIAHWVLDYFDFHIWRFR